MNTPNKITMGRIIISLFLMIFLLFPFYQVGIKLPEYLILGKVVIYSKYVIAGILFAIASASDFIDGYIARKNNIVTDFGKAMDAIADKILVNGVLIILAYDGFIPVIIPVIIVTRDIIVDSIKMVAGKEGKTIGASWIGKLKTIFMMTGITLVFLSNVPFELVGIPLGNYLIILATILSVYSGTDYYIKNKEYFKNK